MMYTKMTPSHGRLMGGLVYGMAHIIPGSSLLAYNHY